MYVAAVSLTSKGYAMSNLLLVVLGSYLLLNVHTAIGDDGNPIVTTPLGSIKGSTMRTVLGKTIYAFRGIRYAKPPVNELRFQPPVPVDAWTNIHDATRESDACPQPDYEASSEDCLFLNVYTTKLPHSNQDVKRPVIVYIHQGGFYGLSGTSEFEGPEYFLDQDIVLVAMNYRLGSLGFISTGDRLAPGNNGLKDQVLALKWIKHNIAAFGGDPNLVTISGYSAGGSSVSLHLVSPMSKGLFQRAIIMSGSSFGNWPVPQEQFSLAQKQAQLVGCPDDTSANIINCLKNKTSRELGESLDGFGEFSRMPIMKWLPVIEPDFGQERFLTDNPAKLVECGKFEQVPVMTTVTREEFSSSAIWMLENSTLVQEFNDNFEKVAPIVFIYERDSENSKHISKELRKFYFGDEPIGNQTKSGLQKMLADGVIGFTIHRAADLLASKSTKDVFYYMFDYQGRFSHVYNSGTETPYGVVHHDDLMYLFYISPYFTRLNTTSPEYKMVTKLTTLFANFAKTGNPTPTETPLFDNVIWKPYTPTHHAYLHISDKLTMKEDLFRERYEAWDKLFPLPRCLT